MSGILGTNRVTQVAIIVKDMEESKKKFAEFFGVPVPDHNPGGDFKITGTEYMGEPAPEANCYLAFFDVGPGLQLELIQPNGVATTWQDYLDDHGEGIHHIAFVVDDMPEGVKNCEEFGMKVVQRGKYRDASGEYTYLDATDSLKCVIELLHSY